MKKPLTPVELPHPVADFIQATNSFDLEALLATFAEDALVNPRQRKFWGIEAIKRWASREWIGEKVTMEVTEAVEHYGQIVLQARMGGEFNQKGLSSDFVLTFYFFLDAGKIVQLLICGNGPAK